MFWRSVPELERIHDRFQDRNELMIDFQTGICTLLIPVSEWVHDRFLERYGFMIIFSNGSWSIPGLVWV